MVCSLHGAALLFDGSDIDLESSNPARVKAIDTLHIDGTPKGADISFF
jgi:hypothetical protein